MPGVAAADPLSIDRAEWRSDDRVLRVDGKGADGRTVTIRNAGNGAVLGTDTVDDEEWDRRIRSLTQVPCRVRVEQSNGEVQERDVSNRPSSCGPVAGALPALSVNDTTVSEGGTASFTVNLSAPSTQSVTVVAGTANGTATAGSDYTARSGVTLTFPAGSTAQTFTVATLADTAAEGSETFTVNLSGAANATIADAQGVGTIANVAPPTQTPSLSINDVSVNEGGTASFTVTLSAPSAQTVTVLAGTANGTATSGSDYTARSGVTLTFPAGSTAQTFTVATLADTAAEGSETFTVNLSGANNATIADAQGVGTIGNVNPPPAGASLSVNDVSVTEGGTATFTVTLSAPSTSTVTVNFSTSAATAGSGDFTAVTNRTLTIAAGQTSVTTQVITTQDTVAETTETFNVTLSSAVNAAIADGSGVGTIVDNDFTNAAQAHATMTTYDGPQTCVACHEAQARQMHGSVHYQQNGPTDFVTNIAGLAGEGPAGKPSGVNAVIGINTYCGTHENSPRFTCAGCHVGNGRFPKTPAEFTALGAGSQAQRDELANIDCLTCHQQAYKRFPDWTSAGAGFSDLTLLNVTLDASGNLTPASGQSVTRTGLSGIPNVDSITKDFMFRPSGAAGSLLPLPAGAPQAPMTLTTEQAAQQAHATTRQSCLNCHAGAAGANGAKRGDLSTANVASTDLNLDRHMATTGSNMTCSNCHNVNDAAGNSIHRVRGRGLDLRANDVATRFTCDNAGCHTSTPHNAVTNGTTINRHTTKVACQTCHIPSFGKGVATETARDWQKPHVTQTACNGRGGWLPNEIKSSTATPPVGVIPSYQWFDGTSEVYYLTEPLTGTATKPGTPTKPLPAGIAAEFGMASGTLAYIMGRPNGGISTNTNSATTAKIYPMKEHWGKLARNTANDTLIPHSTFEFFRTGSFCRAVAVGLGQNPDTACGTGQNTGVPAGAEVVPVHTYQTINHGVEPQANALGANNQCNTCHNGTGNTTNVKRMQLSGAGGLGYDLREPATATGLCNNCHGGENNPGMVSVHDRHRNRNGVTCNSCHLSR
ncbi:MAG TPA: Calx-beta domain-containing protein [Burkholderiales bacterium]|nr:Calx-beta domain-containing protein [Burkholderiales bacterium]